MLNMILINFLKGFFGERERKERKIKAQVEQKTTGKSLIFRRTPGKSLFWPVCQHCILTEQVLHEM